MIAVKDTLLDWWDGTKERARSLFRRRKADSLFPEGDTGGGKKSRWRWLGRVPVLVVFAISLYYVIGMIWIHRVDDTLDMKYPVAKGESHAVAVAAALLRRETEDNRWTAQDPFFLPAAALDNMPNYQQGIVQALARFSLEMRDQIGRTRGSSQSDKDLEEAVSQLSYRGDVWYFDTEVSWLPTTTSEDRYRAARQRLLSYNKRLAAGSAVFDVRADNLLQTLDRIAKDLGSSSQLMDEHISAHSNDWIDFKVDDIFYNIKGRIYGYTLVLKALGKDFESVIAEKGLTPVWNRMIASLETAAGIDPLVIVNGAPDAQIRPSHLSNQGFYLLRARIQLSEIADILQK